MNENFLLKNECARKLYNNYAKDLPIIDYHCHIDAKEIAENKSFKNITELWLGGDHYKWRYMRACGISEDLITGSASDKDKFLAWTSCLASAIGNPLYHWSHLELKKYFDFNDHVTCSNGEELWEMCNEKLKPCQDIIKESNVEVICTTDDPVDSLEYHKAIKNDPSIKFKVLPAFRPDNAMALNKDSYTDYIYQLTKASGVKIFSFKDLKRALSNRMDYFNENGCKLSDHGLVSLIYAPASDMEIEKIFSNRLRGIYPTSDEINRFNTAMLLFLHKEYVRLGWVSQLHYGCKRDNNTKMFEAIGPNTGFDCIEGYTPGDDLANFLNALNNDNALPKIIVYSLNPNDNALIDTIIGCFQEGPVTNKIQHGSAWWFNDNKLGMEEHLKTLAAYGNLSGFVGMLTDSRSFVSYTRHDYFRRILCNFIGELVEKDEFPEDYEILGEIIHNICYYNAKYYFDFN